MQQVVASNLLPEETQWQVRLLLPRKRLDSGLAGNASPQVPCQPDHRTAMPSTHDHQEADSSVARAGAAVVSQGRVALPLPAASVSGIVATR